MFLHTVGTLRLANGNTGTRRSSNEETGLYLMEIFSAEVKTCSGQHRSERHQKGIQRLMLVVRVLIKDGHPLGHVGLHGMEKRARKYAQNVRDSCGILADQGQAIARFKKGHRSSITVPGYYQSQGEAKNLGLRAAGTKKKAG